MNARVVTMLLLGLTLAGCQAAGPGLQVEVRAEPKTGYTPPPPDDVGYGGSSIDPAEHDHTFHLIDYRRLEGIVVSVTPVGGTTVTEPQAPLSATVQVARGKPARCEDFALASVDGRVTIKPAGTYVLRTGKGELTELSASASTFEAKAPGFVEIMSDDADEPVGHFYVAPTPWSKKLRGGDRATFAPLPPGSYVVSTWHPLLPGRQATVQVTPDKQLTRLKLTVGVNVLPKPN